MTTNVLQGKVKILPNYKGLADATKDSLADWIDQGVSGMLDSYLASYLKHEDSEILLKISIEKNGSMYNGTFHLTGSNLALDYKRENFQNLRELVSHAFKHFKESLANK